MLRKTIIFTYSSKKRAVIFTTEVNQQDYLELDNNFILELWQSLNNILRLYILSL